MSIAPVASASYHRPGQLPAPLDRGCVVVVTVVIPLTESGGTQLLGSSHADGPGSIPKLTDETRNLTGYPNSAFGKELFHTGSDPQPYALAGEPYDPNGGLYYSRATAAATA